MNEYDDLELVENVKLVEDEEGCFFFVFVFPLSFLSLFLYNMYCSPSCPCSILHRLF